MLNKNVKRRALSMNRQSLLSVVDEYVEETKQRAPDLLNVAKWAYDNVRMSLPRLDIFRIMARILAQACREDFIEESRTLVRESFKRFRVRKSRLDDVIFADVTSEATR